MNSAKLTFCAFLLACVLSAQETANPLALKLVGKWEPMLLHMVWEFSSDGTVTLQDYAEARLPYSFNNNVLKLGKTNWQVATNGDHVTATETAQGVQARLTRIRPGERGDRRVLAGLFSCEDPCLFARILPVSKDPVVMATGPTTIRFQDYPLQMVTLSGTPPIAGTYKLLKDELTVSFANQPALVGKIAFKEEDKSFLFEIKKKGGWLFYRLD